MRTVYVVIEHFGHYAEDSCSIVHSVAATRELAEQKKIESEKSHNTNITREEWDRLCEQVNNWESENENQEGFDSWAEGIHYLNPTMSYEDLVQAEFVHCEDDYVYTEIKEATFVE